MPTHQRHARGIRSQIQRRDVAVLTPDSDARSGNAQRLGTHLRQHRIAALPDLTAQLQKELHGIEHADDTLDELQAHVEQKLAELKKISAKLTRARKKAAASLEEKVSANMQQLGMPEGTFAVAITPLETPAASGAERIEFQVSINPGMPAGALSRVASGGELSRVSLAIQVAASDRTSTPTMIFDEVDAGVGGATAEIVGAKLRSLAGHCQVMCVTHLAQVASKGHAHFRVNKLSDGKNTRTRVAPLNKDERIEEIARMLGGLEITDRTREHAAEMLSGTVDA